MCLLCKCDCVWMSGWVMVCVAREGLLDWFVCRNYAWPCCVLLAAGGERENCYNIPSWPANTTLLLFNSHSSPYTENSSPYPSQASHPLPYSFFLPTSPLSYPFLSVFPHFLAYSSSPSPLTFLTNISHSILPLYPTQPPSGSRHKIRATADFFFTPRKQAGSFSVTNRLINAPWVY